jgi:PAS domain S-box-containing protein
VSRYPVALAASAAAAGSLALAIAGISSTGSTGLVLLAAGWTLAGLSALVPTVVAALRVEGAHVRRAWWLWSVSAGFFVAGAGVRLAQAASGSLSFPSAADVLWLLTALTALVGVGFRTPQQARAFPLFVCDSVPPVLLAVLVVDQLGGAELSTSGRVTVALYAGLYLGVAIAVVNFLSLPTLATPSGPVPAVWKTVFASGFIVLAAAALVWPGVALDANARAHAGALLWLVGLLLVALWALGRAVRPGALTVLGIRPRDRGLRALPGIFSLAALIGLEAAGFGSESLRGSLIAASALAVAGRFFVLLREAGQAEARLRDEHRFVTTLLDTTGSLVLAVDHEGIVRRANRACERLTGYPVEDLVGRPVLELIPKEEKDVVRELLAVVMADMRPTEGVNAWITASGERRTIAWANRPMLDERGRFLYVIASGIDITYERELEEELRRAHRLEAIGALAGGIAHDFNNLLMAIRGHNEFVLHADEAHAPLRRHAEAVESAVEQGAMLVRQLLAFGRRQALEPQIVDPNDALRRLEPTLRRLVPATISVDLDLGDEVEPVRIDPAQLEQVVVNLVLNARDAMPDGGLLSIRTRFRPLTSAEAAALDLRPDVPYTVLCVADTGVGMDEHARSRAFDPFFSTKPLSRGSGLGLATVHGVVAQSGGYTLLASEPGKGTRFTIILPCASVASAQSGGSLAHASQR